MLNKMPQTTYLEYKVFDEISFETFKHNPVIQFNWNFIHEIGFYNNPLAPDRVRQDNIAAIWKPKQIKTA